MSSYRAGLTAKSIAGSKSTVVYNIFAIVVILVAIFAVVMTVMYYISDNDYYETTEIYTSYEDNCLIFNDLRLELPEKSVQKIKVDTLLSKVPQNSEVKLKIANRSNKLLEVCYNNEIVYQGSITTKASIVIASVICLVMIAFSTLMLIGANVKNPKRKFTKKLWRSLYYNR